jgi:hypothetical protein
LLASIGPWGIVAVAAALSIPLLPQERTTDLRARFDHESNPVQKAKLMPALGELEFQHIRQDVEAQRLDDALTKLNEYRDQAQSCEKGLENSKTDAEKHPAGFKQLEISLQESLRRVDALLPSMTRDEQEPFLAVRKDLDDLHRQLIERLFPRRTPSPPRPATPEEQK